MRYTTAIDITEVAAVWRSHNATRLYLYMAMTCGYHDNDRDELRASLALMASRCGITISAVRCALRLLQREGLLTRRDDGAYIIKKYIVPEMPTPRQKTTKSKAGDIGAQLDKQLDEYRRRVMEAVRASSVEELVKWLHELEEGKSLRHRGTQLKPNEANINWLKDYINRLNK